MNKKLINKLALLGAITTTGLQGSENPGDFLNGKNQELRTTQEVSHQTAPQSSCTQQTGDQRGKLNPFCLVIVSMYFENINDYINLEMSCKEYAGTMAKLKYNPISFGSDKDQALKKRALFPNIETFHVYGGKDDKIFNDGNITKQVDWRPIVSLSTQKNAAKGDKPIIFKKVLLTCDDVENYGLVDSLGHGTVPSITKVLGRECFSHSSLKSINIPATVSCIRGECFAMCTGLQSVEIPNSVTMIGDSCFSLCTTLQDIIIPTSVLRIDENCFAYCASLTNITLPIRFKGQEERIGLNRSQTEITYTQDNQSTEENKDHLEESQAEEHAEADQENENGNDQTADAFSTNDEAWE